MDDPALSDEQVYDLLHEALLTFSNRDVATENGQDVLTLAIRQMELLQRAIIILKEGDGSTEKPE